MKHPALAFTLVLSLIVPLHAETVRPNIVLFLVDDMGWMDCGAYGSQYYETPRIDAFAQTAMRFTQAYAQPLCSPSRASILTGQYAPRHGILTASGHQPPKPPGYNYKPGTGPATRAIIQQETRNHLDPAEHFTLPAALQTAGYRTAHIGKWHLGLTPEYRPERFGFDITFHCAPDPGPPGGYFSPYGVVSEGRATGKQKVGNITDGPEGEYIVDRQAGEAVKFIQSSKDGPFFLNLWCYGVHGPWGHKPEYTAAFAKKTDPRGVQKNPIMASMIQSVDDCFGRILDELNAQNLTRNTVIIFYSDNGGNIHSNVPGTGKTAAAGKNKSDSLADWRKWAGDEPPTNNHPLSEGKSSLYEGGTRVPMMWAWADQITPGAVTGEVAGHIDLYPTLLEFAGLPRPEGQILDGISLAPLLTGKTASLDRDAFFNYFPARPNLGGVTVVSGDFKLFRWFDPAVPRELYNLKEDIGETNNLALSLPDKVHALDALIDAHLKDTGALVPFPNPAYRPRPENSRTRPAEQPLGGWQPKGCSAVVGPAGLVVTGENRNPFLGRAGLGLKGPVTLVLQAQSRGGEARAQWRRTDQEAFPAEGQIATFTLPPSQENPAEVRVTLETESLTHLRLYLPAHTHPVTVQSMELIPSSGAPAAWRFP